MIVATPRNQPEQCLHVLRSYDTAALQILTGLLTLTMTRGLRERRRLAATSAVGLAGEVLLTRTYSTTC